VVSTRATRLRGAFFRRFGATVERVDLAPLSFPIAIEGQSVRKARILRTDYSNAFIVIRAGDIEVVAIAHGAKKPGWWRRRLREPPASR